MPANEQYLKLFSPTCHTGHPISPDIKANMRRRYFAVARRVLIWRCAFSLAATTSAAADLRVFPSVRAARVCCSISRASAAPSAAAVSDCR